MNMALVTELGIIDDAHTTETFGESFWPRRRHPSESHAYALRIGTESSPARIRSNDPFAPSRFVLRRNDRFMLPIKIQHAVPMHECFCSRQRCKFSCGGCDDRSVDISYRSESTGPRVVTTRATVRVHSSQRHYNTIETFYMPFDS